MMDIRKLFFIFIFTVGFFLLEFLLFNMVGAWFKPNFLLLFVVFITLLLGIRYSLLAALIAGILKDSFAIEPFGVFVLSFMASAYMSVVFKLYLYRKGSMFLRIVLVAMTLIVFNGVHVILRSVISGIDIFQAVPFVIFPESFITLLLTPIIFQFLKKCALKLYVLP